MFELEQQRELAQAQFIVDANALRMASDVAVLGENMGEVFSRACFTLESLTKADLTKLDRYFALRLAGIATLKDRSWRGASSRQKDPGEKWDDETDGKWVSLLGRFCSLSYLASARRSD